MKRLLTYLFLVLGLLWCNVGVAETPSQLMAYQISNGDYIYFKSPNKNFKKELYWTHKKGFYIEPSIGWEEYGKANGRACFHYYKTVTFDGKQFSHIFYYKDLGSGQTNVCVPEVYKISAQPNNSIYDVVGLNKDTGIAFGKGLTYKSRNEFVVITSEAANKLCIQAAYSEGVGD